MFKVTNPKKSLPWPQNSQAGKWCWSFCIVFVLVTASPLWAEGLTQRIIQSDVPQRLELIKGKSLVLESPVPIKRASLAKPDFADLLVLSPKQLYLIGKEIGISNLTLWGKDGKVFAVYDVVVRPDLTRLKSQIHQFFPEEQDIKIMATHDHITLAGTVSSTENLSHILALAEPYAPKKIMNLLQVGGVQQVMLEVRVAEMSRGLLKRLGVNFSMVSESGNQFLVGTLNELSDVVKPSSAIIAPHTLSGALPFGLVASSSINAIFRSGTITGFIDALKQQNLAKILAEPTLITMSGQEARFLAGGEFPIPIPQSFGVTTIKFKKFGVGLSFNPTVLNNQRISMKVATEVSELDFSNAVSSQGFTIPALITRRAETIIEVKDGQSFAIAGLLQETIKETIAKYPVLGDIPVLGALFRSVSFQRNETELVIIVTAHLVKPLDMAKQTLPTDSYLEPNDFELMLMGYLEGEPRFSWNWPMRRERTSHDAPTVSGAPTVIIPKEGGLEGQFGHLAP